MEKNAGMF